MDLDLLLERNQLALRVQQKAASDEERRAFGQFVRDCSVRKRAAAPKDGPASLLAISATRPLR